MVMSFRLINSVCGKMFPERFHLTVSLPLLAELIIDACASWKDDPLGWRCTEQLMQFDIALIAQIKTAAPQTLSAHEQDRMILAASELIAAARVNRTYGEPERFLSVISLMAARVPREREVELWNATGLKML